jgi:hypothetical protein
MTFPLRIKKRPHGVGDADAARHQCRQADQREELREPFDIRGQGRGRIAA